MRSGSELMKTLTMFSADSMKVIGRVVDAIGEVSVLKVKRKLATDQDEIASLDKKIKAANKKARRAVGSLVSSAVFMALVAQLFRWLYNKDDEDDNVAVNMTVDAIGNLLGGLPFIKDIYSYFAEGYHEPYARREYWRYRRLRGSQGTRFFGTKGIRCYSEKR